MKVILLDDKDPFDQLNLLMIPNTVTILSLRHTKIKAISEWADLKDKSLKELRLDRNANLELNLDGLRRDSNHLPLECLRLNLC